MLLVVLIAIPLGWKVNRARNQRVVMAELQKLNAQIMYAHQTTLTKGVRTFNDSAEPSGPAWLRKLLGDEYFVEVFQVRVVSDDVTDETIALIARLPGLVSVCLTSEGITDDGLKHLEGMQSLEAVTIFSQRITDKGLAHLTGLGRLKSLWLSGRITDSYLERICKLKQLELLHADGVRQVTDSGLEQLANHPELRSLVLGSGGWNDSGTQDCMQVSDEGLVHLHGLKNLTFLEINTTQATPAGIDKLRKALPNCRIQWNLNGPHDPDPIDGDDAVSASQPEELRERVE
jgi:hypothetical protein